MIRGIAGKPYINLDPYLDIAGFKSLHYKICKGLVLAESKKEGNQVLHWYVRRRLCCPELWTAAGKVR